MHSPALPSQGTPPSPPQVPLQAAVPGEPRCAHTPQHSPSCHVDDTSLARTTSRKGAASCAMLGGRGPASPPAVPGPGAAVSPSEDGERLGTEPRSPPLRCRCQMPDPPAWPCCLCRANLLFPTATRPKHSKAVSQAQNDEIVKK